MVVCVECLPADKPWDVVSVTRQSSGVAPRACVRVRVHARVLVPPNLYKHTYIHITEIMVNVRWMLCMGMGQSVLAFTRYRYCKYCMVCGIQQGGRVGVFYCLIAVQ